MLEKRASLCYLHFICVEKAESLKQTRVYNLFALEMKNQTNQLVRKHLFLKIEFSYL
jgi:hypothetical protein